MENLNSLFQSLFHVLFKMKVWCFSSFKTCLSLSKKIPIQNKTLLPNINSNKFRTNTGNYIFFSQEKHFFVRAFFLSKISLLIEINWSAKIIWKRHLDTNRGFSWEGTNKLVLRNLHLYIYTAEPQYKCRSINHAIYTATFILRNPTARALKPQYKPCNLYCGYSYSCRVPQYKFIAAAAVVYRSSAAA